MTKKVKKYPKPLNAPWSYIPTDEEVKQMEEITKREHGRRTEIIHQALTEYFSKHKLEPK